MNIEPKQPTRKAPADWFTGDARWLEHVTDQHYQAAAAAAETD